MKLFVNKLKMKNAAEAYCQSIGLTIGKCERADYHRLLMLVEFIEFHFTSLDSLVICTVNTSCQVVRCQLIPDDTNMLPPWVAFPACHPFSTGWRQGAGEAYEREFIDWFRRLSNEDKKQYCDKYPEDPTWEGYYSQIQKT